MNEEVNAENTNEETIIPQAEQIKEETNVKNTYEELSTPKVEQTTDEPAKCCSHHCRCGMIFNIIILVGLIVLYVLFFMNKSKHKDTVNHVPVSIKGNLSIAFINTDSIFESYQFAKDIKKELNDYQAKLERDYKSNATAFQNEYENYVKTGASLKLNEQKKKEEELKAKNSQLMELKEDMSNQLLKKQQAMNGRLIDSIFSYINRFNEKPKYTFILKKSADHNLLFANDSLEITKDVIKGLNEEYKKFDKK